MRTIRCGSPQWTRLLLARERGASTRGRSRERAVARILAAVRRDGDRALVRLTARFDHVSLTPAGLRVPAREIETLARRADPELVRALRVMARRIEAYHRRQVDRGFTLRLPDGSVLAEQVRPLESVGLYVPGGAGAYPSSVLMNAIPARVAGVPRIAVVTPPRALETSPAVAAALVAVGLSQVVYRIGGAQAVAALAYGTRSVPRVDKVVGPGNAFVAEAKRQLRGCIASDQEAGPSEVAILADASADAGFVAVDLLAQAEHGTGDESVVLVTPDAAWAAEVVRLVGEGLRSVSNARAARRALARHGAVVIVRDLEEGLAAVNALASEHLEMVCRDAARLARRALAGAVFVGSFSPVAIGDYGIGPNHVLPTMGTARYSSPLSVRDFTRRQSCVQMTQRGLARVAADVIRVAEAEGFRGHALSVATRFAGQG